MSYRKHKHPGAPKGNQNARKHGYYSKVVVPAEAVPLPETTQISNLDHEIALLQTKIASINRHTPDNYDLIFRAAALLTKMYQVREGLSRLDGKRLTRIYEGIVFPTK